MSETYTQFMSSGCKEQPFLQWSWNSNSLRKDNVHHISPATSLTSCNGPGVLDVPDIHDVSALAIRHRFWASSLAGSALAFAQLLRSFRGVWAEFLGLK